MQDRSESRKRSSDVGLEDRRVAATVGSGLRQRTTMIPAVVRDATSSPLDHIEISVFYTSPGKKVLKREPTGTHRDWGYLDIPSLISWNYDLLSPVKIAVEMAVEATNVAPINRLIRSRFAVIGKMKAHLPTSSRSNKMRMEVTGETLKAGCASDQALSCGYSVSESVRRGDGRWWKGLPVDTAALPSSEMGFVLRRQPLIDRWWSPR